MITPKINNNIPAKHKVCLILSAIFALLRVGDKQKHSRYVTSTAFTPYNEYTGREMVSVKDNIIKLADTNHRLSFLSKHFVREG